MTSASRAIRVRAYGDTSQPDGRKHREDGRMKRICRRNGEAALSLLFAGLVLPGLVVPLVAEQSNSLSITGHTGSAKVVQVEGRSFVGVEGFVRLINASVRFNGNQIVITLPGGGDTPPAPASPANGSSPAFVKAAVEAAAELREWRAALRNAIAGSYAISENWVSPMRAEARQALRVVSVSISTPADKATVSLLENLFNNVNQLSDNYLQLSGARTYIDPRSLDSDPLDQKIMACARSLASMATANEFAIPPRGWTDLRT